MCIFRPYHINSKNPTSQYVWSHADVSAAYDGGMRPEPEPE